MEPTLDQLLVLDAIVRTGSFAGAAAALHRVPSAISYSVRNLEESLGVELFDRSRRTAVLTEAGARILEAGREVLGSAEALKQLARGLADDWEPELRVVVDGSLPMRPILRTMLAFQDPAIPTRVRLDVEHRDGVLHRFDADDAHLMAVVGFDPNADLSPYDLVDLPPLELVLVAAAGHPLVASPTSEAAERHPELVVRDSSPARAGELNRSFLGSRHVIQLSDFHAKRLALVDGVGFGWIPRHLVDEDLERRTLVLVPLDGREPRFTYRPSLVRRRERQAGRALRHFVEVLLANVRDS